MTTHRLNPETLGIYLHWPYCARICPYCDFNVYAAKSRDTGPLLSAMLRDLTAHRTLTGPRTITSIYFGGGTPSLMSSAQIEQVIGRIGKLWTVSDGVEITLEANPNDISETRISDWTAAGINRLSIGVQSLDDEALAFLGRDHNRDQAVAAVETAAHLVGNVSIDLMYARPDQSQSAWQDELGDALRLGAHHISLYELTIKPDTPFGKRADRGELHPMPEDDQAELFERTQDLMAHHGYPAYEVSNHATDRAFWSAHNLNYWRSGDWLGIGPGAYGRLTIDGQRIGTYAHRRPPNYAEAVASGENGIESREHLDRLDWANEVLIMGLRSIEGVSLTDIETLAERPLDRSLIDDLVKSGHALQTDQRLRLTRTGWLLADHITAQLAF